MGQGCIAQVSLSVWEMVITAGVGEAGFRAQQAVMLDYTTGIPHHSIPPHLSSQTGKRG